MGGFSMKYVRHLLEFFAINRIIDDYRMDLSWLEQDWCGVSPMQHAFLERTPEEAGTEATEVAQLFRQSSLSRTFVTPSGPTAQTAMPWMLCLSPTRRFSFLTSCNFVLVPIHMNALEHWMVQTTETQMRDADTSKHKIWAKFYDPLGVSSNLDVCQAKWISFTLPLLQQWFDRDAGGDKLLSFQSTRRRGSSTTTDNASANTTPFVQQRVLPEVVAVPLLYAYSYVRHVRSLKTSKSIPQNDIAQMRLRLLWTLLHESSAADEDKDVQVWAEMVDIRKKIKKAFDSA
ncbi:hypothetical protein JG688_00009146 [Phytophthora aleatoria]|uniref:Ubiquitin-like protease family profile domain-containing protein n=1 Tax=Phytophthora aleatoria TaxID=2496075 RepID=A0A8J5MFI0_9STRA|nr:hypothetical protein JG688_00009146 [Phytophthora aleatoria]